MAHLVKVKFKHGKDKANIPSVWSGTVDGKTESAVQAKLKKVFSSPSYEVIELIDIEWK